LSQIDLALLNADGIVRHRQVKIARNKVIEPRIIMNYSY